MSGSMTINGVPRARGRRRKHRRPKPVNHVVKRRRQRLSNAEVLEQGPWLR
jgi:hypothetical protein